MIRRPVVYRRKLRGALGFLFFSFLIFLGVFGVCFGVWAYTRSKFHIVTPLAVVQKNNIDTIEKVQNLCEENHINCTNIQKNNDSTITIILDPDQQVVISMQKDLSMQIASLQLTIAHLTIEGKRFHRIDFRFENPVISY